MLAISPSRGSPMQPVTESWRQAQQLEAAGAWDQVRPHYASILATEPDHVPARLRMSRLEQRDGHYRHAREHALLAAGSVRSGAGVRHAAYVSARLLEFAEEAEAAALVLALDWSDAEVIRQSPVLAQHLWLAGRYADALRLVDAMARHAPDHPLLLLTRANVLRFMGRMDEAEQQYEACLARSPDLADAHWALATHSRARPAMSRVDRLLQSLQRQQADPIARAHLLYALFREYDAAGDIGNAWDALSRGAALMRDGVPYDGQREAACMEAMMRLPAGSEARRTPQQEEDAEGAQPVFIVGMPRTGTTLLDRILGNHADVHSLGERNDLSAAISEAGDRFFRSALEADVVALLQTADAGEIGRRYLQRVAGDSPSAQRLIDKNPLNLFSIPVILQALPHARIICLRRDPMDACFSNLKELFQGGAYSYSYALEDLAGHCLRAHRWMAHWQAAAPASVRVVDYERLVEDPEGVSAGLLDFLGLAPQPGLHEITRNQAPVSTASSSQVREDVHRRAVGAWRRYEAQLQPLRESLERQA